MTISLVLWMTFVVAAINDTIGKLRRRGSGEDSGPVCAECGYDMRATPDRCPECGGSTPVPRESSRLLPPWLSLPIAIALAILLFALLFIRGR